MQNDPHCEGKSLKGGDIGTNVVVKSSKCHSQKKQFHRIHPPILSPFITQYIQSGAANT